MADDKQKNWWFLALGLVVLSLVFVFGATLLLAPDDSAEPTTRQPPRTQPVPTPVSTVAVVEPPPTARPAPPDPASAVGAPDPVASASGQAAVACTRAADCRGPKTADCVLASCEAGRCVFDRSRCECVGDDECDDGVECTRDLCFAATKKCIHIRSDCK